MIFAYCVKNVRNIIQGGNVSKEKKLLLSLKSFFLQGSEKMFMFAKSEAFF